ncbi:hypothetical protein BJ138DRAFT_1129038 [Hygrophoropsis aurantiaca]|uniref:Uncharacterized protein n=1 Tax=Hygrophoropsis aurantiaca TaxID=72124 RepID=A0ACB8A3N2_9AGAM|nr:hypothetical protein BJ138DRAFT_1129038 [Hygrophoropsis aurantiaca]
MSTIVHAPAAAASSQDVTLPAIPELLNPNFLDVLIPPTEKPGPSEVLTAPPRNAMMDALRETAHHTLTENDAPAFSSTLSPTLDAFQGLRPFTKGKEVDRYLEKAWAEDPALTLRIIWCIRSIHDGKSDKVLFYRAFGWLFKNHPRTAIINLHYLVAPVCSLRRKIKTKDGKEIIRQERAPHGYWKDLLNILALATVDELHPKEDVPERSSFLHNHTQPNAHLKFASNADREAWSREQRAKAARASHGRLVEKLAEPTFRALYVAVARLFADKLTEDFHILKKIESLPPNAKNRVQLIFSLSLAGKWAPSPNRSHDRVTNISTAISILLHHAQITGTLSARIPFSLTPSPVEAHVLRVFYQRHILAPSRRLKSLPEPLMSANRWSEIIYTRVSSVCMKNSSEKFFTHDPKRFVSYLTDVEGGKAPISGATLLPHELVRQAAQFAGDGLTKSKLDAAIHKHRRELAETQIRVIEAQWKTLVARLRESGELDNCIAVCDVSVSMGSIACTGARRTSAFDVDPIWPSISLSLLIAQLAKPPFTGGFISFSSRPQYISLDPALGLVDAVEKMAHTDFWGMNTDFNAVFLDLLLPLAVKNKVSKDDMIKRVFVFTDMQFDAARQESVDWFHAAGLRAAEDVYSDDGTETDKGAEYEAMDQSERTAGDAVVDDGAGTEDDARMGAIGAGGPTAADWETNHDVIERAYKEAGYDLPQIVYWDLSHASASEYPGITAPVTGERKGVALLNGFSPSLLKVFMDVDDEEEEEDEEWEKVRKDGEIVKKEKTKLTPVEIMKYVLGKKSFAGLVVD